MNELLSTIDSPKDLAKFSDDQLTQLAAEIREALCTVVSDRTAHFASNLGVVELCIALHLVYDFSQDRLIWDTGHQVYPHKLITGRYHEFPTMRRKGGLMGFPNPNESPYDLFMTGHAGSSVSTVLGLKTGDDLLGHDERKAVAVIGDGALPSGIVFEAMNNAAELKKDMLVILNDNEMGICPRVGGLGKTLDKARTTPLYGEFKKDVSWILNQIPLVGGSVEKALVQTRDALKASLHGGMLFEEMGFRYIGPIDGHDLATLREYLEMVKNLNGPVLLHVFTEKGHGFKPAAEDPVMFHTPPPFERNGDDSVVSVKKSSSRAYTNVASEAIHAVMRRDKRVSVLTAAMCEGNKLGKVRSEFPDRFFDTGICEGHAVAFAAGMAKAGARPVVDIYSTFLQRSFDQIFQEVALQNLPVTFCLDRAGLCGPDGPTHHGVFDVGYMRLFPNMVVMAPGDEKDVSAMLDFALDYNGPVSIRYPKTGADLVDRPFVPVELGHSEILEWGEDGTIVAFGATLAASIQAAARLRKEGLEIGVVNARFAKPLDTATIFRAIDETGFVLTVEEGVLAGGFGSAVLEAANAEGHRTDHIHRLGISDQFVEHGDRGELLADLGLDAEGIFQAALQQIERAGVTKDWGNGLEHPA
ncbi:1-deoxy-D-xylulose-5-phosphate synthase [Symmachiella macrocystis]|uniref:1-deoxy-D-xylulose-5-phosphate synthase n=1 Tax=Symmachiella macrocystis TaxID=2527985 RepID=A0A5C6B5G0_9PLAN|nr:1-deoxy-D-xylulose-5-phosphate synthase [Symmachiella macrocystis]TWU07178.1 1-deoxy-D-xylulose-5-phosphate synthase [Symmachiella macrocystis]